jgi:predicted nucleotidyltransferase
MQKFINVLIFKTIVLRMRTIVKEPYWNILGVFYKNRNRPMHLREISRTIGLKEGALSRHLNALESAKILKAEREANLKKFSIAAPSLAQIYTLFDTEKYQALPFIRRKAISLYLEKLAEKPVFLILFGSSSKGTFRQDSDIDIISVFNRKADTKSALRHAEAQTGLGISELQMSYPAFVNETRLKDDNVVQAGIETGYPIYNHHYYYGTYG